MSLRTVSRRELIATLHEADGYLSLIGYRYVASLRGQDGHEQGSELAEELKHASARCRQLVRQIEDGWSVTGCDD